MAAKDATVRIPSLDGLRTISIGLVIAGHVFQGIGIGSAGNLGNLGVRVFFVISGFLITDLLVREIERTSTLNLLKFYYRRSLRIFPPFYFYLCVILAADWFGLISIPKEKILAAAAYATDYVNPTSWNIGHTWSLAVEEQFYLILPGILLLLMTRRVTYLLIFVIAIAPFVRVADFHYSGDQFWVLKGFHANMDALAVGCLLTLTKSQLHKNRLYKAFLNSNFVFLLVPVILVFNVQTEHPHIFYGVSISIMNISIALILDWAVTNYNSNFGKILNSRPMVYVGMLSYSVYLWQQPFLNPHELSVITRFPFNLIGLVFMTLFSYYLVERPSLRLRQKWESKLFDKKVSVTQVASEPKPSS